MTRGIHPNISPTSNSPTSTDTELPAARAAGDTNSNPTAPDVLADLFVWDGTQWVRARTAGGAASTTGTGLLGVGLLGRRETDGVFNQMHAAQDDALTTASYPGIVLMLHDGLIATRQRAVTTVKDIASTAVTAGTPLTVWTPTAGKKFRLMGWGLSLSVAGSLIFKYGGTPTTMFRTEAVAAAGISQTAPGFGNGQMPGAVNDVLKVDVTATGNVAGYVFGCEE